MRHFFLVMIFLGLVMGFGCERPVQKTASTQGKALIETKSPISTSPNLEPSPVPDTGKTDPANPNPAQTDANPGASIPRAESEPNPQAASQKTETVPSNSTVPGATTPDYQKGPAPKTQDAQKLVQDAAKSVPDPQPITPAGSGGWKKSKVSALELGKRVDQALKNLKNTTGTSNIIVDLPGPTGGKGTGTAKVQIGDSKRFKIQYILLQNKLPVEEVVADGKQRALVLDGKVKERLALTASKGRSQEKTLQDFTAQFPRLAFSSLTEGQNVWEPLLSALVRGSGGFKPQIEERQVFFNNKNRPYYRVVAKSTGKNPAELEMLFDGERMLPLTIKLESKTDKGIKKVQWSGGWSFNKKLDPKTFQIPKVG